VHTSRRNRYLTAAAVALLGAGPTTAAAATSHLTRPAVARAAAPAAAARLTVVVDGAVAHPLRLTFAALRAYPRHAERVRYRTSTGPETHTFRGALLYDVLQAAQPTFDPNVKNDQLRYAILVKASDGYEATLSWAEIDPDYADRQVLLAYNQDNAPLDFQGAHLTVPGDTYGGRYVYGVFSITLVKVGD
jgi:DMSO/TMAO reductase YedYZ molybdopterin-dependent catalytic subunit